VPPATTPKGITTSMKIGQVQQHPSLTVGLNFNYKLKLVDFNKACAKTVIEI